jgi:hypothetical protein
VKFNNLEIKYWEKISAECTLLVQNLKVKKRITAVSLNKKRVFLGLGL